MMGNFGAKQKPGWMARLFRVAGFRWVFPIGTFPVPFHPVIPLLLMASPWIWLILTIPAISGNNIRDPQWPMLLISGALLGIPMSIPFVASAMMAFRAHLAQALFFLAAMIMVIVDWYYARTATYWLLLPIIFFGTWAVQRIYGLIWIRGLRRAADKFEKIDMTGFPLVLDPNAVDLARTIIRRKYAERAFIPLQKNVGHVTIVERIDSKTRDAVLSLGRGKPPKGWSFDARDEQIILQRTGAYPDGPCIILNREKIRHTFIPKSHLLERLVFQWNGVETSLVTGTAAIASPLPFATLFHWTAILGGKSEWHIGFLPKAEKISDSVKANLANIFVLPEAAAPLTEKYRELVAAARGAFDEDDRQNAARIEAQHQSRRKSNITPRRDGYIERGKLRIEPVQEPNSDSQTFWRAVATDPASWAKHIAVFHAIVGNAHSADQEDLRRTLNWLEAAVELRQRGALRAAGQLLAEMPERLLASEYPRLKPIFNSRILGMVWHIAPDFDVKPLPPRVLKFGEEAGFGLIRSVPELYVKLASLAPGLKDIVARLAAEAVKYKVSIPSELVVISQYRNG